MLEIDRLSTFYGQFQALKEVSLKVADGELVAVFGPNGHGKSTLLKTVCGLLIPSAGCIKYDGQQIHGFATKKIVEMGVVYIPEERHLFTELTVLENLKLGAYNHNARQNEKTNFGYVFSLFPRLKDWRNRQASTLSGGEARMLAIARGLMSSPKFLAVDEPSVGLAPNLRADVFRKIKEISTNGISILLVEQNVLEASSLADRIYLMEDGRIIREGREDEILSDEHVKEVFLGV
jgi:branched-chain amino acid transport system ATP-binding protein